MWASEFSSLKIKERGGREGEEIWKREKKRSEGKKKGGREDWGGDIEEGEKKSVSERRTCGTTYVNTDILTRLCVTGSGGAPGPLLGWVSRRDHCWGGWRRGPCWGGWRARTPAGVGGAPGPLLGWAALGVPTGDCLVSGRFWVSVIPAVPRASPAGVGGAGVAWGAYRPVRRPVGNAHSLGPRVLDRAPLREASANASCIPDLPRCNGVGPPRVAAG